jgi:hypothetical protein
MFGSFFKKQNSFDVTGSVLLIDIRNSSVGAAIVTFSKDAAPVITHTFRDHYYFESSVDSETFVSRAELSLKKVLDTVFHTKTHTTPVTSVEVFYGAPWYRALISNVQIEHTSPTEFTEDYLQTLTEKNNTHITSEETAIEKEIVAIMLNGYKISDPFYKKATHFDVSFLISCIGKDTKTSFETIIKKYARTQKIHSHSHPYAIFSVIDKRIHAPKHYTILDISGEMIELSIVKDDHFRKIISIPYGSHSFVRALATSTKTNFQSALLKLRSLLHTTVDEAQKTARTNLLKEIKREWSEVIQKTLAAAGVELIPSIIFVSGDEEIKELIVHMLEDVEIYTGAFKINRKPQVQFIASSLIKKYCTYNKNVPEDHQLATEAVFVELLRVHR